MHKANKQTSKRTKKTSNIVLLMYSVLHNNMYMYHMLKHSINRSTCTYNIPNVYSGTPVNPLPTIGNSLRKQKSLYKY